MKRRHKRGLERVKPGAVVPARVPLCCTCGKPLLRLPPSFASPTRARVFQCADCFYPGTGLAARPSAPMSSARNRWLEESLPGDSE